MSFLGLFRAGSAALAVSVLALGVGQAHAETLADALARAYQNNPEIASALLAVKSSAENIVQAKSSKYPTIGFSVSADSRFSVSQGVASDSQSASFGLGYDQTLFDNGRTDAQIEAARAGAEASEYGLRNTEQNILLQVATAYMNVVRDSQLVDQRNDSVSFFQAQLQSAQDRLEIGEGTRIEVAQAQARLAQGVASYRAAVASVQASRATYERYVGGPPVGNLSGSHSFGALIPDTLEEALASAEVRHPAILSSRAAIRAAQAGADAAAAAFGPTIGISGSLANSFQETLPGTFNSSIGGSVGVRLSVPIYAGGALGASVRQANLDQVRSEVDAMAVYDQVREAVVSSWTALQNSDAQIQSAEAAVNAGQLVLEGVIQERDLGQRTTLDVLNSQSELTSAREGLISARTNRVVASFALISATGRLSAQELGLPVEIKSGAEYTARVEDVWQELRTIPD